MSPRADLAGGTQETGHAALPPFPIIVGVPRSGTTLLRLMLDAHPDLAIPPETGFLPALRDISRGGLCRAEDLLAAIVECDTWPDFGLDRDDLCAELGPRTTAADAARAFYRLYARRHAKPRAGDKTPMYVSRLRAIEALLPEARFVHLIRDGRDVAISLRRMWFSPGHEIDTIAAYWREQVTTGRTQGAHCAQYLEVRYENLVREPEPELRRLCQFLELPFSDAMLRHHERATGRLREHRERRAPDGQLVMSRTKRLAQQANSMRPPDPTLIGRWRVVLTERESASFAAVAGGLLHDLGYPT